MDLLRERLVIPWAEAEARISYQSWKDFAPVQPIQLSEARNSLEADGSIVLEHTDQHPPVTTVRLPFVPGWKRCMERLRGARRKWYRTYSSWAQEGPLCGKHAERVVLQSLVEAASAAGLWVPEQTPGEIHDVRGVPITRGPLDCYAHILDLPELSSETTLVVEVKNIHSWIYQSTAELWELLVKAAEVATSQPVVPLLVCVRSGYPVTQMAKDIGFFACFLGRQAFSPEIPEEEFDDMVEEFGLAIERHEGSHPHVLSFAAKTLRQSPPYSPPTEDIAWYRRQADRFRIMAAEVLAFDRLAAGGLSGGARKTMFDAFRARVTATATWPLVGGW
jgi:hypothetical protein